MFTPRQLKQVHESVSRHGLQEQAFELLVTDAQVQFWHKKTRFTFKLFRGTLPPAIMNMVVEENSLTIEYSPHVEGAMISNGGESVVTWAETWSEAMSYLNRWLLWLKKEYGPFDEMGSLPTKKKEISSLTHLHPTIQQVAGKLFADGHYRQALLDAFIAVDNAVQAKSLLTDTGTKLMEVAFSPSNPVLKIGDSPNEQQGFLALFRGAMLAIRNPKAHSLGGTHDAQRALEWLSFASVLLRNLDEAVLAQPSAAPPAL